MAASVFEMFKLGVGPSSSHTVGPMRAALLFVQELEKKGLLETTQRVVCDLMGSLGATGKGHATDKAVYLGLAGKAPATVSSQEGRDIPQRVENEHRLTLTGKHDIVFVPERDMLFTADKVCAFHTNAMDLTALASDGKKLLSRRYYSVGGGFIVAGSEQNPDIPNEPSAVSRSKAQPLPYPYRNGAELLILALKHNLSFAQIARANERVQYSDEEINRQLDTVAQAMDDCINRGLKADGLMPGPFGVKRRAKWLAERLAKNNIAADPLSALDWINAWAFAVGEENACGGRVVTSPTNGAAGVIPAVLRYYRTFIVASSEEGVREFLLTASAIGLLYKTNASISGAEVGCQGEVGVACSMAAGALAAVLGANPRQVENAAEIGMEHCLGLTCDPVAGQVQIPCIERNAVAAVKAVNAARLALAGDGSHIVSLDAVMQTMYQTGRDMQSKYRETSRGGLAVNLVQC